MRRYCINPNYLVDANEQEILFYTPTNPPGVISTALWKYQADSREIHRCFEIGMSLHLWKYPMQEPDTDLQYIGIRYPGTSYVVGLNDQGEEIFSMEPGEYVDICGPAFDTAGCIYLSVDNQWIYCINPAGELMWKWKSPFSVPDIGRIERYWVFRDRLYVITCGQLYVISLSGNVEESHIIYEYPCKPIQYQVWGERLLLIDMKYRDLICYNLKGEKLWQFRADSGEKILRIEACEKNRICLGVTSCKDSSPVLYVLNEKGEKCWSLNEKWWEIYISSAQEIVLLHEKNIAVYSAEGENISQGSGKKNIIYANVWGDRLRMIAEGRGKISVVDQDREMKEKPFITKLPDIKEDVTMTEKGFGWTEDMLELIMMNLELFGRYSSKEILQIRITCELFAFMRISVRTYEDTWEDAMAEKIPCEQITEEDRDGYKECCYRNDILWTEFCDVYSEDDAKSIMNAVCKLLGKKYGTETELIFQ